LLTFFRINDTSCLTACAGNAHHGENVDEDENVDNGVSARGIFPRSLYCRYVLPELYKIFHVRDALVRATLLRHFHRYAAMFDHTTLSQLILPQVCFVLSFVAIQSMILWTNP